MGFSGKKTGVGDHAFLQGFSHPGDRTQVSRIAGEFFAFWDTREAPRSFQEASKLGPMGFREKLPWNNENCQGLTQPCSKFPKGMKYEFFIHPVLLTMGNLHTVSVPQFPHLPSKNINTR